MDVMASISNPFIFIANTLLTVVILIIVIGIQKKLKKLSATIATAEQTTEIFDKITHMIAPRTAPPEPSPTPACDISQKKSTPSNPFLNNLTKVLNEFIHKYPFNSPDTNEAERIIRDYCERITKAEHVEVPQSIDTIQLIQRYIIDDMITTIDSVCFDRKTISTADVNALKSLEAKVLMPVLTKYRIEAIQIIPGQTLFDVRFHESIGNESISFKKGSISKIFQRGFQIRPQSDEPISILKKAAVYVAV